MIRERLVNHLKLCRRNLRSGRVKCCATCPFEDDIVKAEPAMATLFEAKRAALAPKLRSADDILKAAGRTNMLKGRPMHITLPGRRGKGGG